MTKKRTFETASMNYLERKSRFHMYKLFYIIGFIWSFYGLLVFSVVVSIVSADDSLFYTLLFIKILIGISIITGLIFIYTAIIQKRRIKQRKFIDALCRLLLENKFKIKLIQFTVKANTDSLTASDYIKFLKNKKKWKIEFDRKEMISYNFEE